MPGLSPVERRLWGYLRDGRCGVTFRSHSAACTSGKFAFVAPDAKLAVDVGDGNRGHDRSLASKGWRVLRVAVTSAEADPGAVVLAIGRALQEQAVNPIGFGTFEADLDGARDS
ncbi:hypothetical protein [Aquisphaera giovannonii]|uniref:hypothetical protein n=1 Tax=Aquisphaera giovannonii TaxID=406548 RepID=UPI001AEF787A|nr:hypothetical protein [Aquisphaera giovannonii]